METDLDEKLKQIILAKFHIVGHGDSGYALLDSDIKQIKQLFLDTIEKAKPEKQDTDRGRHALNMSANGWNNGISTFEANLRKEIGK